MPLINIIMKVKLAYITQDNVILHSSYEFSDS